MKKAKKQYMRATSFYDEFRYVSKRKTSVFDNNDRLRRKRDKHTIFMKPNNSVDLFKYIINSGGQSE
jgi:hypothetical protein